MVQTMSSHSCPRMAAISENSRLTWMFSSRFVPVKHCRIFVQSLMWSQKYLTQTRFISNGEFIKTAQGGSEATLGSATFVTWANLPCPSLLFDLAKTHIGRLIVWLSIKWGYYLEDAIILLHLNRRILSFLYRLSYCLKSFILLKHHVRTTAHTSGYSNTTSIINFL